jgi:hypothetical protein
VERAHGTHQDRLVKKLRLAGIANYDQANAYQDEHHLAEHKRHYARQLDEVFWLEEERVVSQDWGGATRAGCCNWNGKVSARYLDFCS